MNWEFDAALDLSSKWYLLWVFEWWVFKYIDSEMDLVDLFDSDGEDEHE
jgi:hypothetical protein